jgi:hypothetical protein
MGAQGLMQVMAKVHHDKFQELGGIKAALNPVANIRVGSQILKEYVTRGGSVEAGLKSYVGAADMANDGGYGIKVLSEYQNLKQVAMGKNISIYTTATVKLPVSASAEQPKARPTTSPRPPSPRRKNNSLPCNKVCADCVLRCEYYRYSERMKKEPRAPFLRLLVSSLATLGRLSKNTRSRATASCSFSIDVA